MNTNKWRAFFNGLNKEEPKYDPSLSLLKENVFDSLDMTYLTEAEVLSLMEGRKDNVIKKYGEELDPYAIESIVNFDEQYRFKHLQWMAREIAAYNEDDQTKITNQVIAGIGSFVRYGQNLEKKDINQYANLEELLSSIQDEVIAPRIAKARQKRMKNPETVRLLRSRSGTVVYEDERYFVVRPDSAEASCHFGSRTRWCIAQTGNSYFSQYTSGQGKIFYFIKDDTQKNDAYNYKMAVEMSLVSGEIQVNNIWDRYDENVSLEGYGYLDEFAQELTESFEMPEDKAENIAQAIFEHAEQNLPAAPLAEVEERVRNGEWDGGLLSISAYYEDYDETPYLILSGDVEIRLAITNPELTKMLDSGEIDITRAEENLQEELEHDGKLYELLDDEVDIGASKWWWPESDRIEVSINSLPGAGAGWELVISMANFVDPDEGGYYVEKDGAIQFCEYMKEEWGERNETEILEVLENNYFRFIPEYALKRAQTFVNLKNEFTSGRHDIEGDMLYYTVDDDEDESSDLNLFMEFRYDMNPEYVKALFDTEEIENANGQMVTVIKKPAGTRANIKNTLRQELGAGNSRASTVSDNLGRSIYNVYNQAYEFATRQLKLDFGEEWNDQVAEQWELPEIPTDMSIDVNMESRQLDDVVARRTTIVPTSGTLVYRFSIYVNFNKSDAELMAIKKLFLFIKDNYEKISSYIYKYTDQYSQIYDEKRKGMDILSENLLLDIMEANFFLSEFDNEMKLFEKKKRKKKKKKKKSKKDACYHKVRSRYSVWPSAYASGALVKCRKVGAKNWGNSTKEGIEDDIELIDEENDELMSSLESLLEDADTIIDEVMELDEKKKKRKKKKKKGEGLHKWFSRKGAKGSKGGWVDCNAPDGKGGYKACGRSGDEKRKRYPACRPTAGQCKKKKGTKGKSWGKKDAKRRGKKK